AIRYFLVGLVVIFFRGLLTERITAVMWARRASTEATSTETPEEAAVNDEVVRESYTDPAIPGEEANVGSATATREEI
ncbi:MAG TPA: PTS glucitol/sorbitol transporter subunit IIC, partial [Ktedonobacteraceae bacterium]|nr:PTS glucitol/sorbitol transporter subunit IIC [Ktedonobacteraceae bacterium]